VAIHPLAVVSPDARVARDVQVGPFTVVEPEVTLAAGCELASHVVVKRGTCVGRGTRIGEGTVLGGLPQHTAVPERPGGVSIGSNNVIREHVTVHRALHKGATTCIGDVGLLMAGCHVAHDCVLGNSVILTNGVLLAGHVEVGDQAYLAGAVAVHQFCRIGRNAMVGGMARVLKDVPPYVTIDGATGLVVGLNLVGLRRAGFERDAVRQLKEAYRLIYRRGLRWQEMVDTLRREFASGPVTEFSHFFAGGRRGFVQERRVPNRAVIKLHRDDHPADDQTLPNKAAG